MIRTPMSQAQLFLAVLAKNKRFEDVAMECLHLLQEAEDAVVA